MPAWNKNVPTASKKIPPKTTTSQGTQIPAPPAGGCVPYDAIVFPIYDGANYLMPTYAPVPTRVTPAADWVRVIMLAPSPPSTVLRVALTVYPVAV